MKYWNKKGNEEAKNNILHKLIDAIYNEFGDKEMGRSKNKHLERLRKAKYVYYRFYNDGDFNSRIFKCYFGCGSISEVNNFDGKVLDDGLDKLILAAYAEQKALGTI